MYCKICEQMHMDSYSRHLYVIKCQNIRIMDISLKKYTCLMFTQIKITYTIVYVDKQ